MASSTAAPHFFKLIYEETILQGDQLRIPRKFTRKYGKDLSDTVFLKVPNGATWQLQLTKCDDASDTNVWSLNGFQSFAKYYSLELGHFLIFRYHGNSNFCVIICDKSAVEIDYPLDNAKFSGESSKVPQTKDKEHEISIEILDDLLPTRETRNRTPRNGGNLEKQKSKPDSDEATEDTATKPSAGNQKLRAMTSSFKSKNPFFMVPMQPSYVRAKYNLNIPADVTKKHFLRNHGHIDLLVSNDRSWRVKYTRYNYNISYHKKQIVQFSTGWKLFVQDNKLAVGDVCVFEMINGSELSLQVVIFRACEDANSHQFLEKTSVHCPGPQKMSTEPRGAHSNEVKLEKPKRKLDMISMQDLADEGLGDGCMTSSKKRLKFGIPKARMASFSSTDKAKAFQKGDVCMFE